MQQAETNQHPISDQPSIPTIPFSQDVVRLIRHAPEALLERLIVSVSSGADGVLETELGGRARVRELTERLASLKDDPLGALVSDAERIVEMTDELGQEALHSTIIDRESFVSQENATARALWAFLEEPGSFRRAEEIRYADNYRLGRMWDGFVGPKDAMISGEVDHHREFEERIPERRNGPHRHRQRHGPDPCGRRHHRGRSGEGGRWCGAESGHAHRHLSGVRKRKWFPTVFESLCTTTWGRGLENQPFSPQVVPLRAFANRKMVKLPTATKAASRGGSPGS